MEGGGGVVHRHDGAVADPARLAVNAADALAGDEFVEREAPQGHDHQGVYGGDLAVEVVVAGADLAGFGDRGLSGGRHLMTLAMKTCRRLTPMERSRLSRN